MHLMELQLTNTKDVAIIDAEDFDKVKDFAWRLDETGYVSIVLCSKRVYSRVCLHQVILGDGLFDHINRNRLDNRKSNLRKATYKQNSWNRAKKTSSKSKYKGVSWHKIRGKWNATIKTGVNKTHLGSFDTEEAAALAYNYAAKKHFGQFAVLNDVVLS
jgi:hypothetical protein